MNLPAICALRIGPIDVSPNRGLVARRTAPAVFADGALELRRC